MGMNTNQKGDLLGKLFFWYMIIATIMSGAWFFTKFKYVHSFFDFIVHLIASSVAGLLWPISIWGL